MRCCASGGTTPERNERIIPLGSTMRGSVRHGHRELMRASRSASALACVPRVNVHASHPVPPSPTDAVGPAAARPAMLAAGRAAARAEPLAAEAIVGRTGGRRVERRERSVSHLPGLRPGRRPGQVRRRQGAAPVLAAIPLLFARVARRCRSRAAGPAQPRAARARACAPTGCSPTAAAAFPTAHLPAYTQFNASASRTLAWTGAGDVTLRFDIIHLFDRVYEIRNGTGVGVGAPQFGPRRGFFFGISKAL